MSLLLLCAVATLRHSVGATSRIDVDLDSSATARFLQLETALNIGHAKKKTTVDSFCIVVMPDTQHYPERYPPLYTNQSQWIADQIEIHGNPLNIVFVAHMGDVVEEGSNESMWANAESSMSMLHRSNGSYIVPYNVLPGNHDYRDSRPDDISRAKSSGITSYLSHFGPSTFADAAWYGGADSLGTCSFQYFLAGRIKFLHLSLEWAPHINVPYRDVSPLEWAEQVLQSNLGLPVVLSTHEYLSDGDGARSPVGDAIFNQLVRRHDNIFLVLCGHFHSGEVETGKNGVWHQTSTNDFGRPVIEVMQTFQDYMPVGGSGWLRILKFNPSAGTLHIRTYSPWLDEWKTETVEESGGWANDFTLKLNMTRLLA